MPALEELYRTTNSAAAYVAGFRDRFANMVEQMDVTGIVKVIEALEKISAEDGTVFVLGNGGSAAVAAHWVNDLGVNSLSNGHSGYRVVSLADNASAITATGNDIGFDDIFAAQLRAYLRPGDAVVALSVSGNSTNVVRAIEYANLAGALSIAFTGMNGGKLKNLAEISIHVHSSTDEYGPVEDMFSVFMHIATGYVTMRRGRSLYH